MKKDYSNAGWAAVKPETMEPARSAVWMAFTRTPRAQNGNVVPMTTAATAKAMTPPKTHALTALSLTASAIPNGGNTAYDDNKQTCCDGVLHDMIQVGDEKRLFKCGLGCGEAGDYGAGEKCCLDGIYPDPKGTKWKCCKYDNGNNGQGYDTTKNTCANGVVGVGNSKCGNTAYDTTKNTCFDGVVVDGVGNSKCGNTAYDDNKQTCCDGVLHDMIQVGDEKRLFKCGLGCGEAGDYGAGEKCCLDGIYPDPKGTKWKCCKYDNGNNGQGYDTTKNTCANGVVSPLK